MKLVNQYKICVFFIVLEPFFNCALIPHMIWLCS